MPQFCEVLKYEGDNSTFIWKHPSEDFNSLKKKKIMKKSKISL